MLWSDPVLEGLSGKMDVSALRQKVIAQNIANLNTPGYKRSYVPFIDELERARGRTPLTRTDPAHRPGIPSGTDPRVQKETHTSKRADGNNVELDREMLDMVTNQLRFNALTQKAGDRLSNWRYIINEGRR